MTATIDITAYTEQHGHPPLVVGRQYNFTNQTFSGRSTQAVTLILAGTAGLQVTVANRWGYQFRCNKRELEWRE